MPSGFVLVAEQTGLIVPIGAWAIAAAAAQARAWHEEVGWPGWISVNLSARQVAEPGLAASVQSILAGSRLDPDMLGSS